MHTTVEVVTADTAVAALSAAIVVTLVCTSLSQHCHCHCCHNAVTCSFSLPQRCARFRCYSAVLVFAVTALCSFSLLQRCAHRCLTAVEFLLCIGFQIGLHLDWYLFLSQMLRVRYSHMFCFVRLCCSRAVYRRFWASSYAVLVIFGHSSLNTTHR